jgi:hypothetical protein
MVNTRILYGCLIKFAIKVWTVNRCERKWLLAVFCDVLQCLTYTCVRNKFQLVTEQGQGRYMALSGECSLLVFLWIIVSNITLDFILHLSLVWLSNLVSYRYGTFPKYSLFHFFFFLHINNRVPFVTAWRVRRLRMVEQPLIWRIAAKI